MAIKIDGSSGTDIISAADGSLTIEGVVSTDKLVAKTEDWITHTGDTNTRMGFPDADTYAVETAGTERLRIDSGGSVTIGDAATHSLSAHSEGDDLVIGGAGWRGMTIYGEGGGGVIQFADNGDNRRGQIMYNHGDDSMMFRTGGNADRFTISNIGEAKFTRGSTGTVAHFYANARECNILLQNDAQTWKIVNYDYGNNGTDNLGFHDGTADRLVIAKTGKIGINNTNPDYTLDVRAPSGDVWVSARGGTNQGFQVRKSDNTLRGYAGNGAGVNLGAEDFAISAPAGNLSLCTGGTASSNERLRIDSNGSVHIDGPTAATHGLRFTPNGWNGYDNRMGFCGSSGADFWWSSNWNPTDGARDHSGYATNFIRQNVDTGYISFGTGPANTTASERLRIYHTNATNTGIAKFTSPASGDMLNLQNSTGSGQGLIFGVDTSASPGFTYWKNNTSGTYDAAFIVGGNEKLRIFAGGGIHVKSASVATGTLDGGTDDVIIENSTSAGIAFKVPNSERSTVTFATTGTGGQNEAWIQYAHESVSTVADRRCMMFRVGGGEKCRISGDGKFSLSGDNDTYLQRTDANQWRMHVNGNYSMEWSANKRIRTPEVWSTNGSNGREVEVESDGTLFAGNTSIRAAKKNIVSQTDVSWLYDLNPVTFNYRKHTVHPTTGVNTYLEEIEEETSYGLIAEEVEVVKKDFCFYNKDEDGNDELTGVSYKHLITPLLKALQDQKKEIDALKTKVAALESA